MWMNLLQWYLSETSGIHDFVLIELCITEWADGKENEDDVNVWEDNWDDDNVEDDFNQQLRAQLENQKK